jgi:2-keto-4-pentenoate hydratase/2-oxohepta-3-ene-1,7-dioic acid hydratase in catechol pathway
LPAAFSNDRAVDLRAVAARRAPDALAFLAAAPADPRWLLPIHRPTLAALMAFALAEGATLVHGRFRIGPPVPRPGKIIACGRNYMDHVREGQKVWAARGKKIERPAIPAAFIKLASAISYQGAPVLVPPEVTDVDYEVELAVIIGEPVFRVAAVDAYSHIAGYSICNDLATRPIQFAEMEQQIGIVMGKNLPGFAPMGPWLVTSDELTDPQNVAIGLKVNGEMRQEAHTSDMLFSIGELVAHWSKLGLQTGDILLTGTPAGVAVGRPLEERARFFLKHGDVVEAWVAGIGTLLNFVQMGDYDKAGAETGVIAGHQR